MHVRDTQEVPHVVYVLLSLFCFVLFLPIWLVHHLSVESSNARLAFRCTVCGSIPMLGRYGVSPFAAGAQFVRPDVVEPPPSP